MQILTLSMEEAVGHRQSPADFSVHLKGGRWFICFHKNLSKQDLYHARIEFKDQRVFLFSAVV